MRSRNLSRYGCQEIFTMIDQNGSGTIEDKEWRTFYEVILGD